MDVIIFLLPVFAAGLVIAGLHVYMGIHIVARGVIFVDLALAQTAALGTTVGILFGLDPHSGSIFWWSLGFAWLGAIVLTLTRTKESKVPQEAFIGIVFVVTSAISILILTQTPHGSEQLRYMLVGNILTVTWPQILKVALVYLALGGFHWVFRDRFQLVSFAPKQAAEKNLSLRVWDLAFYISLGIMVTASVPIAGVLLVFSYLVIPAVCAMLFAERTVARLLLGWGLGTLVSMAGVAASYFLDLPTGATIVVTFGAALLICVVIKQLFFGEK
ncbi:MAG: metal ABC transporter permease [candidate division Zixibacteria bacterium]|nr:metal ABC transporter permease [candidate division Zixibacteria bacterium]